MHHRNELAAAKQLAIELMGQILRRGDSINEAEIIVAQKISSNNFQGFNSLSVGEIDDIINLVGYYWSDEDKNSIAFIDMLLEHRSALEENRST